MRLLSDFRYSNSLVRDQEVDGSNPFAPTTFPSLRLFDFFLSDLADYAEFRINLKPDGADQDAGDRRTDERADYRN